MPRAEAAPAPLEGVDLLLADLDGVVYAGARAIPHAVEALNAAQADRRVAYITNNASRTAASVAEHLTELGLHVEPDDIVTSPHAAVELLADAVPAGSTVLVVGGEGLSSVVEAAGFRVTDSARDVPAAVIQGFHPAVGWAQLAEASFALNAWNDGRPGEGGIPWIATNTDWTIPQERGTAPGNGTLVSAVHTAVGRLPRVAGKPEPAIFHTALARFGGASPLFLGDRIDTDIRGARRAGVPSALVLTGIDGPKQLIAAAPEDRPDFVLADLRELAQPYLAPVATERRGGVEVRCGTAVVSRRGAVIRLEKRGEKVHELRAACAAVWGSGLSLYALDVDARLSSAS
ncbi:MAG: HAD-IIA family hydrolase [Actinomycetales bacterium]|nr:HAD-IIA family hydrolase [Actinomycetales bacterium]